MKPRAKRTPGASAEVVCLNGDHASRSRRWQRKAAGRQRHRLERRGFGEGADHGRAGTGGTRIPRDSIQSAKGAGAKKRKSQRCVWHGCDRKKRGYSGWRGRLGGGWAATGRRGRIAVTGGRRGQPTAPQSLTPSGERGNCALTGARTPRARRAAAEAGRGEDGWELPRAARACKSSGGRSPTPAPSRR